MKRNKQMEEQSFLSFNDKDILIIDEIQRLPEDRAYYSEYGLLMFCTAGKIQWVYDGRTVTIHEGEIFLGMPGCTLSDYMLSPDFDCKLLAVKPAEVTTTWELQSQIINSMLYIKKNPTANLTEEDKDVFFSYYNLICKRIQNTTDRYKNGEIHSLINAFMLQVVSIIDRNMKEMEPLTTVRGEHVVEKFIWLVNENSGRNRFVEHYAQELNLTPKYLSTLVKASLGRTPTEIIRGVTLKEIERRLRYSEESIKEISHALNFPNTSFFGKYFKQYSGLTPMAYRNKYRNRKF